MLASKKRRETLDVLAGTKTGIQQYVTHRLKNMEHDVQVKLKGNRKDMNKIPNGVEIKLGDLERKINSRGASSILATGNRINKIKLPDTMVKLHG